MFDARPPDLRRLLAPIGAERFLADYWQQRMVSLELDAADFAEIAAEIGPLDIARLAGLARSGTRAWIANDYVAHSEVPVDAANAAKLFAIGATLYFLDLPLEPLTHGIAVSLGLPPQNMIASIFLTPASGGAPAHFDKNDNFTVQLTGAKRWTVATAPAVAAPQDGYVLGHKVPASLRGLLDDIDKTPRRTVDLRPGSLLYVPRGTVHGTAAGEASWSLNLSYTPVTPAAGT